MSAPAVRDLPFGQPSFLFGGRLTSPVEFTTAEYHGRLWGRVADGDAELPAGYYTVYVIGEGSPNGQWIAAYRLGQVDGGTPADTLPGKLKRLAGKAEVSATRDRATAELRG